MNAYLLPIDGYRMDLFKQRLKDLRCAFKYK